MPLKLIGAGFGRTGTTSLQAALEELGLIKCYHMIELIKNPAHAPFWERAIAGEEVDWQGFFADDYQATVDWPGCTFYKELMEAYPEAKVLLSVREPDRWYESAHDTIYTMSNSLLMAMLRRIVPHANRMYHIVQHIWGGTFEGRFADKDFALGVFNDHLTDVMEHVPPERLLIYNVREGWEPLCRFLDLPVPEGKPFPHLNDKTKMQKVMRYGPPAIFGIAALILILLVWLVGSLLG